MKKVIQICFMAALLTGGLAGCYDDKGNYDYRDINEMTYTIKVFIKDGNEIAIDTFGNSRCKQSPEDITVVYRPVVTQSMMDNDENIGYEWRVLKQGEATAYVSTDKELELEFPKNTASMYHITFRVMDSITGVSFYKTLVIKTVQPYLNSWFVLNENENECRLSVIEEPDSVQYIVSYDAYGDLGLSDLEARKVISDAQTMIYSPNIDMDSPSTSELLQIMTKDGVWKMKPNALIMNKMRIDSDLSMKDKVEGSVKSGTTAIVDERGQLYLSTDGESYELKYPNDDNYRVDVIGHNLGEAQVVVFWDNTKKRFGYVDAGRWVKGNVCFMECEIEDVDNQEILWIGPEYADTKENCSLGMAVGRDKVSKEYTIYHITQDENNEYVITPQNIGTLRGDAFGFTSAPYAWDGQFFYISGNSVYRFNGTDESIEIYDAGNPIRQMKFRILTTELVGRADEIRILGLAVEGANGWELHQISLTNGGDLEEDKVKVFEGFGPIRDFCFSFRNSLAD